MIVLGSEVTLGNGTADVLALERTGRFVLIEVKLASNSEARRAVVAQLLSYASFLRGVSLGGFEVGTLARHLHDRGAATIAGLASREFQDAELDGAVFRGAMQESLNGGAFRLVWVLDDAPPELVSLVGYLEDIAAGVVIDLVTVAQYEVGGARVIVPQRVEPERVEPQSADAANAGGPGPVTTRGADDFISAIELAPASERPLLKKLADWAVSLQREGIASLTTTTGVTGRKVLRPAVLGDDVGLVTIWNENGRASLSLWRSVFERRAPSSIEPVEAATGIEVSVGRAAPFVDDKVLAILSDAYREAAKLKEERIDDPAAQM